MHKCASEQNITKILRLLTYSGGCVADVTAKIQPHGCLAKSLLLTDVYKTASPQM